MNTSNSLCPVCGREPETIYISILDFDDTVGCSRCTYRSPCWEYFARRVNKRCPVCSASEPDYVYTRGMLPGGEAVGCSECLDEQLPYLPMLDLPFTLV